MRRLALLCLPLAAAGLAWIARESADAPATRRLPAPLERTPGEREEHQRLREAWIETLHRAAPGTDWRAQDAAFRAGAIAARRERIEALRSAGAPAVAYAQVRTPAVTGQWIERGSGNIAGRTLGVEFDVPANRLNVFSHGGNLWRADRASLNWTSPGDGFSFPPLGSFGFLAARDQAALFSPRYTSSTMYLLDGLQLSTLTPGTHAVVPVSTIPATALASTHRLTLSGGYDGANVFLYAFIERGSVTEVWRSLDGGASWIRRTDVPTGLFGLNSAESSTRDPLRVYAGGVNAYRSHDGGASWQLVNAWQDYYGQEATRLHADIPNIDVFVDGANVERVFVSTDGGSYESLDGLLTVQNLSLAGLRNAQYYGSYTVRGAPNAILAGAQDQGYQKAMAPVAGLNNFVQTISGDYAHLTSSNNGGNLWMVYPGFVQLDTAPASGDWMALRSWSYTSNNLQDWLFLAPLEADPLNPNRALLAGGGIGANRNRVITLTWNGASISHAEGSFDFGSKVTDVQYSRDGLTRYVVNDAGQFYRDSGAGFTLRSSGLPDGQFFYGNCILVHATTPGTIYVAGAGYSGPGVYRSTSNGDSFSPFNTGLPSTLVYHLAMSADGAHLFAATELGPYYYDNVQSSWVPISAAITPDQVWWHVDYVDALQLARFSSYGRGIWDFVVGGDRVYYSGFEN